MPSPPKKKTNFERTKISNTCDEEGKNFISGDNRPLKDNSVKVLKHLSMTHITFV